MRNVYIWMTLALVITGLAALVTASSPTLLSLIFASRWTFWGLAIVELALVWYLAGRIQSLSFSTATLLFILYSAINGVTFSCIFLVYSLSSIVETFFITAGAFAGMAVIGTTTKKDLSAIGNFCYFALIGLIIAGLVRYFIPGSDFLISCIGVLVFAGLTAWDTQKIKLMLEQADDVNDGTMKLALMGSLSLYLDFVNLFIYFLRFFGRRD